MFIIDTIAQWFTYRSDTFKFDATKVWLMCKLFTKFRTKVYALMENSKGHINICRDVSRHQIEMLMLEFSVVWFSLYSSR
jgi:hypothetical protein